MSKIRLHGSSSGYMEIAPPAAGSSATVTLPNSAGEILLSDGSAASLTQIPAANLVGVCTSGLTRTGGFGKIGQFSQTLLTYNYNTSSTTLTDVLSASGVTAEFAMTPSATSSKILFSANMFINALNVSQQEHRYQLSLMGKIGSGSYYELLSWEYLGQYNYMQSGLQMNSIPIPFSFLWSPSTTSAISFKMQVKTYSASASLNFSNGGKDSQINLFEVVT